MSVGLARLVTQEEYQLWVSEISETFCPILTTAVFVIFEKRIAPSLNQMLPSIAPL